MGKRDNKTGTINQGSDGYWRAKVCIGKNNKGAPVFKSFSGKTRAAVKQKLDKYIKTLDDIQEQNEKTSNNITLSDDIVKWAVFSKKNKLKPASYKRLMTTITNQIIPRIGTCPTAELTYDYIQQELINGMFEDGQSLSSIKKAKSALNDFYKHYQKTQLTKGQTIMNIVELVELPSAHNFETKEIECLTDEEVKSFLDEINQTFQTGAPKWEYKDFIILILNTGIRLGEACALTVDDYNEEEKTLFIRRDVVEVPEIEFDEKEELSVSETKLIIQNSPKTSSSYRKVPLNKAANSAIERLLERAYTISPKIKYLAITRNNTMIWPATLRRSLNRMYKAAGLNHTGVHLLRHTYATALFAQNIDLKTVSSLLGHSNIQITSDIYVHFNESLKYSVSEHEFKPYPEYLLTS